jgi:CDP-diacylglycerol--glycerol-3-phosphate 3-phosphatidyltransferase
LGGALITDPAHPVLFALLPIWQLLLTALAAIDGTMAVDFGQKSRVGGVLNEVGDLVSDGALVAPFVAVPTFSPTVVVLMVGMIVAAEGVGVAGQLVSSGRRLEGPFGKVDRAIAFGLLGLWVSLSPPVGWVTNGVCVFFLGLLALTISNRALQVFAAAQLDAARRR